MLNQLLQRDDRHEFKPILTEIEEQPANPLGHIIFWLVIAAVSFFIAWTCLGEIDVVESGQGKIIPDGNIKTLQPLDTGVVRKILVHEGQFVKANQLLMEIDPSTTRPALESDKKNLNYGLLEIARIQATLNGRLFIPPSSIDLKSIPADVLAAQQRMHDAALSALKAQLGNKTQELAKVEQQLQSAHVDELHNAALLKVSEAKEKKLAPVLDIIARDDYEKVTNDILVYKNKIDELRYQQRELAHQESGLIAEMSNIRQEFRKTQLQELGEKQKQVTELRGKVDEITFRNARQQILSPLDGYVDNLLVHTVGGVVTPAEKLVSIVPVNTPLIIKAKVSSRDIGGIKTGMPVSIKLDAFDFQKYGLLHGKVRNISRDSRDDQKLGPMYDVEVTPQEHSLLVDGRREALAPGMSLRAEIRVGKRRIIEFFIYPMIKYLNEGISVK